LATAPSSRHNAPIPSEDGDEPRIVRERDVVGPDGEEQIEAVDDRGRHWYRLRPYPPRRYDVAGFGVFWWAVFWLVIVGLIVWGWGWGWGT